MSEQLCVVALGGNLGDVPFRFRCAMNELSAAGFRILRLSSCLMTRPVACVPDTPDFYNAAVTGYWDGTPQELLRTCQDIEKAYGRPEKHAQNESRTLDLDIILFGSLKLDGPDLVIPHPRAAQRDFVRRPLREIAPELEQLLLEMVN